MLNNDIYNKLTTLTEDESNILKGEKPKIEGIFSDKVQQGEVLHIGEFINIVRHIRFCDIPEHKHDFIEIAYVYKGKMIQKIKGAEIELKKGEIIFLNQYIQHEIKASSEEDIILNFVIKPKFFEYLFSLIDNGNVISKFILSTIYSENTKGEYIYFRVSEIEKIQTILEEIIEEFYNMDFLGASKLKLLIGLLVIELLKNVDKITEYTEESFDTKLVMNTLRYIEEFYKDASLATISEKFNQPYYRISKLIKEFTGLNFKELLQEKRLEKAIELLKNSNYSIEYIIEEVGYENASYFYKIFKTKYGISPKEYRNKIKA